MHIMFFNALPHVQPDIRTWRDIIKLQIRGRKYHKFVNEGREIPKEETNMQTTKRWPKPTTSGQTNL